MVTCSRRSKGKWKRYGDGYYSFGTTIKYDFFKRLKLGLRYAFGKIDKIDSGSEVLIDKSNYLQFKEAVKWVEDSVVHNKPIPPKNQLIKESEGCL